MHGFTPSLLVPLVLGPQAFEKHLSDPNRTCLAQQSRLVLGKRNMLWAVRNARGACSVTSICQRHFATAAADIGEIGIISGAPSNTFKRKVKLPYMML